MSCHKCLVELQPQILKETQCATTDQDTTCITLHNKTRLIVKQHRGFSKKELQSALAQQEYLCSCFHPMERHSFVCHCTPEKCWCTCCYGKRMYYPHRVLKHKHRSMWCTQAEKATKVINSKSIHLLWKLYKRNYIFWTVPFCNIISLIHYIM